MLKNESAPLDVYFSNRPGWSRDIAGAEDERICNKLKMAYVKTRKD
jgi:hypothetical protein